LAKFYAIADLFVLPSLEEVWGLVLNEAMAAGLPIITTERVGGARDLVKDEENGYLVKSGNIDELSERIGKIILDTSLLGKMGERSHSSIKNFSLDAAIKEILKAISYVEEKN